MISQPKNSLEEVDPGYSAISRREFLGGSLKVSILGALALNAATSLSALSAVGENKHKQPAFTVLRDADVLYFAAVLPAIITSATTQAAKNQFLRSLDKTLAPVSAATLDTIRSFIDLVCHDILRRAMTLVWKDWSELSITEIDQVLNSWKTSSIGIRVSAYALTTQLTRTAWYMIPENQLTTGYPGHPKKIVGPEITNA